MKYQAVFTTDLSIESNSITGVMLERTPRYS